MKRSCRYRWSCALFCFSFLLCSSLYSVQLDKKAVPATGRHKVLVTSEQFGRYAVMVKSSQGVALRLVDRMAGPGQIFGQAGVADGRIDAFLERGEYLLLTEGHERASGEASLDIHQFTEERADEQPLLEEFRSITTSLHDFRQRSYWIDVTERKEVIVEAAGRDLGDLRLWKDGLWMVDAQPSRNTQDPEQGHPLQILRLKATLDPGLYLVTAYGGAPLPWAEGADDHPLHLRYGIPMLGAAGRSRKVMSAFGFDQYQVPTGTNFFRLELPGAAEASLRVDTEKAGEPFQDGPSVAKITKKVIPPVAQLQTQGTFVTVRAAPGQVYVLQHFETRPYYEITKPGAYWVSTVTVGDPGDSFDLNGVLWLSRRINESSGYVPVRPTAAEVIELDAEQVYSRRANLLGPVTLFVRVTEAGVYQVMLEGISAEARFEPLVVRGPSLAPPGRFVRGESARNLNPGYYVLTIQPLQKGILNVTLKAKSLVDTLLRTLGVGEAPPQNEPRGMLLFPEVRVARGDRYQLLLNNLPGCVTGLCLRSLPVDVADPLPLFVKKEEALEVPAIIRESGELQAVAEDGSRLQVSLDGVRWAEQIPVQPGPQTVRVRNSGAKSTWCNLMAVPERLRPDAPLPTLSQAARERLPDFPLLEEGSPSYLDLPYRGSSTFRVRADRPALYEVQSTGLLATSGNLRSRAVPTLVRASENGVGRNFLINQFLRPGEYQLTVDARARSAGHLGVSLNRSEPLQGGGLELETVARYLLPARRALLYEFAVGAAGEYRLRALGAGRQFRCRLEDDEGWPLMAPNGVADVTRKFAPGKYRFLILPEATPARVITLLSALKPPPVYKGHGPHTVALEQRIEHLWLEPQADEPRQPDQWQFEIPARLHATIQLTAEMQGSLLRTGEPGSEGRAVAFVPPGRPWTGILEPGQYRLDVVCSRRNNRVLYQLEVRSEEMVAGISRMIEVPSSVPVSVGPAGLVQIHSFGSFDVKGSIYSEQGKLLASADDRPGDWNFLISHRFPEGSYTLKVEPVGGERGKVELFMKAPPEITQPVLEAPSKRETQIGGRILLFPLRANPGDGAFIARAESQVAMQLTFEARREGVWQALAQDTGLEAQVEYLPSAAMDPADYRLRLVSMDPRRRAVEIRTEIRHPQSLTEAQLAGGFAPSVGVAEVQLTAPGLLALEADSGEVFWAAARGEAFAPVQRGLIPAFTSLLSLGIEATGKSETVKARRVTVTPGPAGGFEFQVSPPAPVACDIEGGPRALLVKVASRLGQPGVRLIERGEEVAPGGVGVATEGGSALAAAFGLEDPQAVIWAASGTAPFDTSLEALPFSLAAPQPLAGFSEGQPAAATAPVFQLPDGLKRIRISLDRGMAAALRASGKVEELLWAESEPVFETMESRADSLVIFPAQGRPGRYAVNLIPLGGVAGELTLGSGYKYEVRHAASGRIRLRAPALAGDNSRTLHVRGDSRSRFLTTSGRLLTGSDIPIGSEGGTLEVSHGPGMLLCWIDDQAGAAPGPPPPLGGQPAEALELPSSTALDGLAKAFRVEAPEDSVLRLKAPGAEAAWIQIQGESGWSKVYPSGLSLDLFVPRGTIDVTLWRLGGEALSGYLDATLLPVVSTGEGLGPEVLLAPGETRFFRFRTAFEGPVGIGVRASSDVVEAELFDDKGQSISRGVVMMPKLTPGDYILALHGPDVGDPVEARPAVAGIERPGTGPPADVIRKYVEMAREEQ